MANPPLDPELHKLIWLYAQRGLKQCQIKALILKEHGRKVASGTVSRCARTAPPEIPAIAEDAVRAIKGAAPVQKEFIESDERNGDERELKKVVTKRIKTLRELAEVCEIDTSEWEIFRWKCGAWQTGMKSQNSDTAFYSEQYVVMAWMRLKRTVIAANNELNELRKKAGDYAPHYPALEPRASRKSGNLAEFSLYDHHFGALIWGKETGGDDYDNTIATKNWETALTSLVSRVDGHKPEKALLVLGNDQQNADNRAGTTERGTPQNMDSRYQKVFSISRDASIWAVDALLGKYGAVDVVVVAGNHDPLSAWHLGDSLTSWYRNCPAVKINNSPVFRKYYQHGVNMLLFTHGHGGKLEDYSKTMAAEQPAMWGSTKWREAHTGDKHHRRLLEFPGATVRILPSLRPPCAWSSENHYVGTIRAAEAYVWNRNEGLVGTGVFSILGKG